MRWAQSNQKEEQTIYLTNDQPGPSRIGSGEQQLNWTTEVNAHLVFFWKDEHSRRSITAESASAGMHSL